ncbi:MAG: DUF2934 domain-containing protein [Burkholderiales bacterium]
MANRGSTPSPRGKQAGAAKFPKPASGKDPGTKHLPRISPEERERLVAEAAYFMAERRGFEAGREVDDWLQAEAEVNRRLGGSRSS